MKNITLGIILGTLLASGGWHMMSKNETYRISRCFPSDIATTTCLDVRVSKEQIISVAEEAYKEMSLEKMEGL